MGLKDILVHVDSKESCTIRLEAAASLAARHGAHLTGLYVIHTPVLPAYVDVQIPREFTCASSDHLGQMRA